MTVSHLCNDKTRQLDNMEDMVTTLYLRFRSQDGEDWLRDCSSSFNMNSRIERK
jgi:hypothetical protein